jgi:hypothetical protein
MLAVGTVPARAGVDGSLWDRVAEPVTVIGDGQAVRTILVPPLVADVAPFGGCTSIHGVRSPGWFDTTLSLSSWPPPLWSAVCQVTGCESGFDPTATNGRYRGLMQVDWHHPTSAGLDLYDPADNLTAAWLLWRIQGWGAWSCGWTRTRTG